MQSHNQLKGNETKCIRRQSKHVQNIAKKSERHATLPASTLMEQLLLLLPPLIQPQYKRWIPQQVIVAKLLVALLLFTDLPPPSN